MKQTSEHWLLIRGLAREARHWGAFPEALEAGLKNANKVVRVDAIDLPGAGRYSEMTSPFVLSQITDFVREKFLEIRRSLREQGLTPPSKVRLVAVSLGGMIASDWMFRYPDEISGCVLINTSFKGFSPIHHRLTPWSAMTLVKILRTKEAIGREREALRLSSNRADIIEQTAEAWRKIAEERPVSHENFMRQLLAAARFQPPQEKPHVPVLILGSATDRMVNPACSVAIAKRWESAFEVHPTAGHDLALDEPAWTVEKIVEWDNELP